MAHVGIETHVTPFTVLQQSIADRVLASLRAHPARRATVVAILRGDCPVSLRMMDWMVTNYARTVSLRILSPENEPVYVHDTYRAILNAYRRRHFDPFRRTVKTSTGLPDSSLCRLRVASEGAREVFDTSVGQLNFLEWAARSGVVAYVESHKPELETAMNRAALVARQQDAPARRADGLSKCHAYEIAPAQAALAETTARVATQATASA